MTSSRYKRTSSMGKALQFLIDGRQSQKDNVNRLGYIDIYWNRTDVSSLPLEEDNTPFGVETYMPQINQLPDNSTLSSGDLLVVMQQGTVRKLTWEDLLSTVLSSVGGLAGQTVPAGVLKGLGGVLQAAIAGTDFPGLSTPNIFTVPQTLPVLDKAGQVFNVKAYGAKGDGTTDDTTTFQAALTAAGVVNGQVYVPTGTYYVGPLTIPNGVSVVGAVRGASIIKLKNGLVNGSTTVTLASLGVGSRLENLVLDGNIANNPGPAEFSTSVVGIPSGHNGAKVIDCVVKNGTNYGVFAFTATDLTVRHCELSGHGSFAVWAFQGCHRVRIEDNWFHSLGSSAIKVHSSDSAAADLLLTAEDPNIVGNIIDYRGQTMADSNQLAIELFHPANNQSLSITATGGTYTLQVAPSGTATAVIAFGANASTIASALNTAGISAQVSGTGPYTITVAGAFLLVNTGSLTGGSATISVLAPPIGVNGGNVSGNKIWGPTGGSNTIFGISLGGCTNTKCSGNTVLGPNINIGIETANATRPIVTDNVVDGAEFGWSASGTTYHPTFKGNKLLNCTTYGAQIYGNTSGSNQGSVIQAQIVSNTWIDCGTNNVQDACIFFNGSGRGSTVSDNKLIIKDSPNPIRLVQVFGDAFATEFLILIGNFCTADPLGTSAHGVGLCQFQGSRYALIIGNSVYGASPLLTSGDIDGIVFADSFGGGHLVMGNRVHNCGHNFYDLSAAGLVNRYIANNSNDPTVSDYIFIAASYAWGNLANGVPVADQNPRGILQAASNSITFGSAAPATGTWVAGDLCWNTSVVSGGTTPEGWRCTLGGTPGTWSAMANHP